MDPHIHIEEREDCVVATVARFPGCQGVGRDANTAVMRLQRAVSAAYERLPPSPFATVRKRLAEASE